MTYEARPTLKTILADARGAGYSDEEIQELSGAWLVEGKRGLQCHRSSDYLKLRRWWAWRFYPDQARADEVDRPPVRFDPKEAGWDRLLRPPGSRGTPRFEQQGE